MIQYFGRVYLFIFLLFICILCECDFVFNYVHRRTEIRFDTVQPSNFSLKFQIQ